MSARLASQLRSEEGSKPYAYADSMGYWTIGVGRLIDRRKGGALSDDEIDYLLQNDIRAKTAEVRAALPWFDQLGEARQGVLVGMAFQLGTSGLLQFAQTLAAVRDQRFPQAAALMLQSQWAKQTPQRAARLARQMETDEWQS
jgi:lysozyme